MRPVEVEWLDSVQGCGWEHPQNAQRDAANETMRCRSLGYVLDDQDGYLLLSMSLLESGSSVHAPLQIPKAAVVSINDVARTKRGKKAAT